MAIKMVREPSETPNINNIDDIIPMRYAYGGQNGFVIGKGNEISNTVNGLNFTVNSGRLVLQGVECDIDAVGVTITIDNIATKRYYVVYLQVNLGLNTAQILSSYDTATYPTIDAGDDLTENTTGVARLPLYRFTATSGIISDVNKVVESVKYTSNMSVANANLIQNVDLSSPNSAKFGDYIYFKRQLLWSGTEYSTYSPTTDTINTVGEITFSDEVPSGTLLEIWSNGRPVYVSAGRTDTTIPDTYASWTSGYVNIVFNSIKFETTTTGLTFTMKQSLIKVSTTQDTIVTSRREGAVAVSNVTKVYAIIRD